MPKEKHIGRVAKYPWDKWFSKKRPFVLRQGVDFDCTAYSMMIYFRNVAKRREHKVHILLGKDHIEVTIVKERNA